VDSSPGSRPAADDHDDSRDHGCHQDGEQVSTETELRLLKVRGVADRLGLSTSQVWELLKAGELDSVKIGAARRVRSDEVDRFIKSLTAGKAEDRVAS
jgi:excisionase family DNA binding protein